MHGPRISHLCFADDSIVFGSANFKEAARVKQILALYEAASGQQLNFDKSAIMFSTNTRADIKEQVAGLLGVREVEHHDLQLWGYLVEKFLGVFEIECGRS